eukprot:scaffold1083_cov114-Cylindrotheca_fusiformis.AAC.4
MGSGLDPIPRSICLYSSAKQEQWSISYANKDHCFDDARRMSSEGCARGAAFGAHPPSLPLLCSNPVGARTSSVASRRVDWSGVDHSELN